MKSETESQKSFWPIEFSLLGVGLAMVLIAAYAGLDPRLTKFLDGIGQTLFAGSVIGGLIRKGVTRLFRDRTAEYVALIESSRKLVEEKNARIQEAGDSITLTEMHIALVQILSVMQSIERKIK